VKGLLLKDFYMGAKYMRTYLMLVVIFLGSAFVNDNLFFVFYPCILSSMIAINLLAYDERSKWDAFCGAMPVSKRQVVSGKYLLGLICQCVIVLLTMLVQALRMHVNGGLAWENLNVLLGTLVSLCCFSVSIPLPLIFRLGVEKGRMVYYVMVGVACGGSFVAADLLQGERIPSGLSVWTVAGVGIVLYMLSWQLSIRWYEKREIS